MKTLLTTLFLAVAMTTVYAQIPSSMSEMTGGGGIGDALSQFASKGLSADALSDGFDVGKFANDVKGVSDIASIGGHVNNLIGHIKPGMFKEGVDVNKLLDMGNSAKSIADATGLLKGLDNSLLGKAFKSDWSSQRPAWQNALDLLG